MAATVVQIDKIISGGQTGADQGGLQAAHALNIPTGGTAAKGFMTTAGKNEKLGSVYGLVECDAAGYPARTEKNVGDATVTVVFRDMRRGSKCRRKIGCGTHITIVSCHRQRKPHHLVDVSDWGVEDEEDISLGAPAWPEDAEDLCKFLREEKEKCSGEFIVNIAGHREFAKGKWQRAVREFLIYALLGI